MKEYFELGKILIEFAAESWQWPENWFSKKSQKIEFFLKHEKFLLCKN